MKTIIIVLYYFEKCLLPITSSTFVLVFFFIIVFLDLKHCQKEKKNYRKKSIAIVRFRFLNLEIICNGSIYREFKQIIMHIVGVFCFKKFETTKSRVK